jgi:hypothetical protein
VIPDHVRGRVMSVMMMSFGLMPLGAVPASIAAKYIGVEPVVAVGGVLMMASVAAFYALYPQFRSLDAVIRSERDGRDAEHRDATERAVAAAAAVTRVTEPAARRG